MKAKINQFLVSAGLGSSIGPVVRALPGQIAAPQLASTLLSLQHRRRHLWADDSAAIRHVSRDYLAAIKAAFLQTRDGYSPDRVIADPELNERYRDSCLRDFGINDSGFRLNLALLQLRKAGQLTGLRSRRTTVPNQWSFVHAAEIAARSMYYQHSLSVDSLICHTDLVVRFDAIAEALAPGHTPLQYRWAALNARKKGAEAARHLASSTNVSWTQPLPFDALDSAPKVKGLVALQEYNNWLIIESSEDMHESLVLGQRIATTEILPRTLWSPQPLSLAWRLFAMPESSSEHRYGLVHRLIPQLHPVFNIPRGSRAA